MKTKYKPEFETWKCGERLQESLVLYLTGEEKDLEFEEQLEIAFGRVWFRRCQAATREIIYAKEKVYVARKYLEDGGFDPEPEPVGIWQLDNFGYKYTTTNLNSLANL